MSNRSDPLHRFKQRAKELKNELGCTHAAALNILAQEQGYDSYLAMREAILGEEEDVE